MQVKNNGDLNKFRRVSVEYGYSTFIVVVNKLATLCFS